MATAICTEREVPVNKCYHQTLSPGTQPQELCFSLAVWKAVQCAASLQSTVDSMWEHCGQHVLSLTRETYLINDRVCI